jgi:uncharacterized protein
MSLQDQLPPSEETRSTAPVASVAAAADIVAGPTANDKTMGLLSHLLGIFFGAIGPLIIWLTQKDTSPWAGEEAKEALNFQITMLIGWAIAFVLTFMVIGVFLYPVLGLLSLIFSIMGAMEANKGNHYKYPFALRLIQ